MNKTPLQMAQAFLAANTFRGTALRTVLLLRPIAGGEPVGWGLLRSYVEALRDQQEYPGKFEITELQPGKEKELCR